jgi:hypothetical protein
MGRSLLVSLIAAIFASHSAHKRNSVVGRTAKLSPNRHVFTNIADKPKKKVLLSSYI